jgi:8-oxo-dGTP pyrophosphatase MutT (NUDIX family)
MEQIFTDRKGNKVIKPEGKEVFNRVSAYGIAMSGNKILLVNPTWKKEFELPGGAIENEDIIKGLKREFLEETGYPIKLVSYSPLEIRYSLFYADDIDTFFNSKQLFFLVKLSGKRKLSWINKKEIHKIKWCDITKLSNNTIQINRLHLDIALKELIE